MKNHGYQQLFTTWQEINTRYIYYKHRVKWNILMLSGRNSDINRGSRHKEQHSTSVLGNDHLFLKACTKISLQFVLYIFIKCLLALSFFFYSIHNFKIIFFFLKNGLNCQIINPFNVVAVFIKKNLSSKL